MLVSETYIPLLAMDRASDLPDDLLNLNEISANVQKGALFKEK